MTVSVGSFHVLLVDEDEQHAELIARWLRKKQFVVTVCVDGEEAVSLMQEIYEVSRARSSLMAPSHTFSHHSQLEGERRPPVRLLLRHRHHSAARHRPHHQPTPV